MTHRRRTHHAPVGYSGAARLIGLPDFRGLMGGRPDATALTTRERDFDDLEVLHSYRSYDPDNPGEVKYFVYHLSQRNPGEEHAFNFVKVVRLIRLTRVPRYLRQQAGSGANMVFEQQRDIIVALRERDALFLNVIAKAPDLPLVFAYGVQGTGATFEEAASIADDGYAVLTRQLDGIYQQLEYKPIDLAEGEALARYQSQWRQIAVARGRPVPASSTLGVSSYLDGNRTDVESTGNQLEAFLRGMGDASFMLSLVTTPVSIPEITSAWKNLSQELSRVRSDQQGQRGFSAGLMLPIGFGQSVGDTHGNTSTDGYSQGLTDTVGTNQSHAEGRSVTDTVGTSQMTAIGETLAQTDSTTQGVSASNGGSVTHTDSTSDSTALGTSQSTTHTDSVSNANSTGSSQSLSSGASQGSNWSSSSGTSLSQSTTSTAGTSQMITDTTSSANTVGSSNSSTDATSSSSTTGTTSASSSAFGQSFGTSSGTSSSLGNSASTGSSTGVGPSLPGLSGSMGNTSTTGASYGDGSSFGASSGISSSTASMSGTSQAASTGIAHADTTTSSQSQTTGTAQSVGNGTSQSTATGLTTGQTYTNTVGGSYSTSATATNGIAQSNTVTNGSSDAVTQGTSQTHTTGRGSSDATGTNWSQGTNSTQGASTSRGTTLVETAGTHQSTAVGSSSTDTVGSSQSTAQSTGSNQSFATALSRSVGQTVTGGVAPSLAYSVSKSTFDEGRRKAGDVLAAQQARLEEGIKSGALMYQMFLTAPDRHTLLGAAGLLKAAFFGTGNGDGQLPQPFHVITDFPSEEEAARVLLHAQCFTQYRKRDPYGEHIEPYLYSTFLTPSEAAAFTHPPTNESAGLLAVHDSMPVMAMPFHRQDKDIHVGHVVNGERGRVSDIRFGLDTSEFDHVLVAGITGTGKTVTVNRLLSEVTRVRRTVTNPDGTQREVKAGVLALDWMSNLRDVAQVVEPERFQFFSISKPHLGEFRYNVMALPDDGMSPTEWLDALGDLLTAAFGLGDYGRSLLGELMLKLYQANRLQDFELLPPIVDDETGEVLRERVFLPAIDPESLPPGAVVRDAHQNPIANVFTYGPLSRLLSISDIATLVTAQMEAAATVEGGRLGGTSMRDRLGSLWRRLQPFAPGNPLAGMLSADPDLATHRSLTVDDLVDPDRGLVTVVEADGLDNPTRRVVLGALVLAVFRKGMVHGDGFYNQNGKGPGTFLVLEEAHELLGEQGDDEDRAASARRTSLYEQVLRRSRALGLRVMVVVQNPASIPSAISSNISTVFIHRVQDGKDRQVVGDMMGWQNQLGQQIREFRWLAEQPRGWCVVRNAPRDGSFLEAAPVQVSVEATGAARVRDDQLQALAAHRLAGMPL